MSFSEFRNDFNQRYRFYERDLDKRMVKKIYNKLLKGKEIRLLEMVQNQESNQSLTDIFVQVPQVDIFTKEIQIALNEISVTEEAEVRIVYGDYGHGKSQTSQIVLDNLMKKRYKDRIFHFESASTIRDLTLHFCENLKRQLMNKGKILSYLEEDIMDLETLLHTDKIGLSGTLTRLMRILYNLSKYEVETIIFIDEIDKITRDTRDIKEWVDFFRTFNDKNDIRVLLILLTPQHAAETLRKSDRRLECWDTYFDVKGIYLDGKYQSKALYGVANLTAMSINNHRINFNDQDLTLIYDCYNHRKEYLMGSSIRSVNIWSANVVEILNNCHQKQIWKLNKKFNSLDITKKGQNIEKKLRLLLTFDTIQEIQAVSDEKSEEKQFYRMDYKKENLQSNNSLSDGHYKVYLRSAKSENIEFLVAVEIKYTEERYFQPKQIDKMIELSKSHPVIFFALGLSTEQFEKLENHYATIIEANPEFYPIHVIAIPKGLLAPLICITDKEEEFYADMKIARPWSIIITDHRNKLENIFRKLPGELRDREITLNTKNLIKKSSKRKLTVSGTTEIQTDQLSEAMIFGSATMVSIIDSINTYKGFNTMERDLRKKVNKKYPIYVDNFVGQIQDLIDLLVENSLIEIGQRGGKDTIKKTVDWDKNIAMDILQASHH